MSIRIATVTLAWTAACSTATEYPGHAKIVLQNVIDLAKFVVGIQCVHMPSERDTGENPVKLKRFDVCLNGQISPRTHAADQSYKTATWRE